MDEVCGPRWEIALKPWNWRFGHAFKNYCFIQLWTKIFRPPEKVKLHFIYDLRYLNDYGK